MCSRTKRTLIKSPLVKEKIASFLAWNRNPKTAKEVWMLVFKESGIKVPVHLVRRYLKEDLQLSYKIGKSRPAQYDWERKHVTKIVSYSQNDTDPSTNLCHSKNLWGLIFSYKSCQKVMTNERNEWDNN